MLSTLPTAHAPRIARVAAPPTFAARSGAQQLRATLLASPRTIAPKWLYDARGCVLYEAITELPEYHLPRVERAILGRHQPEMLRLLPHGAELIDIGSGDGLKARRWLDAGIVCRYIGVDIAEDWLSEALRRGQARYPQVQFDGVVTDLNWGLQLPLAREGNRPRIFWYPGSSIGNFEPVAATALLAQMRALMQPGDALVLAVDGPVEPARMVRAYDDAAGVTAAFNLNVLNVVNRELGADFDPAGFRHRAVFNADASRIEMHLVATRAQSVDLGAGRTLSLTAGEHIVTEHSYKHSAERALRLLRDAGFNGVQRFDIEGEAYGVYVAGIDHAKP
ncbi:L-histidine N(alpha)-methyltransferase [Ottowia testudinis]|uniref:L-histidine N(Alpha)-methyltransferase n=1 Tax=Ottowia testudinis TaxID=2816950 RepID=A0A975CLV3_9BURK|nr:L-histidine N(alpha)-methyltransferase [Ottowia testudinis]QTD46574.1 L-histidine N(alpha)-methyltransferase [Ottowia testudinis]